QSGGPDDLRAHGRCPTFGRQKRVHKVVGKPHRTRFPTAPTRLIIFCKRGNPIKGATKGRSVTVTYGLTGPPSPLRGYGEAGCREAGFVGRHLRSAGGGWLREAGQRTLPGFPRFFFAVAWRRRRLQRPD